MSALEQYCRRIRYFVRSLDSSLNLIWACHTGLSSEDFSFVTYFFVVVASQRDSLETAFSSPENSLQSQVASSMLLCVGHFAGRKWQAHKQHSFHSLRRWRAALASVERQHLLFTVNEIWGDEGNMNIVGTDPDLFFYVSHPHVLVCRPCTEVYSRRLGWAKRRALSTLPTFSWCTRHLVDHCYLSSMAPAPVGGQFSLLLLYLTRSVDSCGTCSRRELCSSWTWPSFRKSGASWVLLFAVALGYLALGPIDLSFRVYRLRQKSL